MNENKLNNETIIAQLAYYYREPLYTDEKSGIENPRIIELIKYFNKRFKNSENAVKFAERIKESFQPTMTVPFPLLADVIKIDTTSGPPESPEWIGFDMPTAIDNFAKVHYIPLITPENATNAEIYEMAMNTKNNFGKIMKKYGALRVYEVFKEFYG